MSIWKEIRHSLNSTLCTSSFLPLDKMIENAKLFLSNKIDNNQTNIMGGINNIVASTTGVGRVVSKRNFGRIDNTNASIIVDKFIAPVSGLYKIVIETTSETHQIGKYVGHKINPTKNGIVDGANYFFRHNIGDYINVGLTEDEKKYLSQYLFEFGGYVIPSNQEITPLVNSGYFYALAGEPVTIVLQNEDTSLATRLASISSVVTCGNS